MIVLAVHRCIVLCLMYQWYWLYTGVVVGIQVYGILYWYCIQVVYNTMHHMYWYDLWWYCIQVYGILCAVLSMTVLAVCMQVRTDTDNDDGSRVTFVVYNIPSSPGRSRMLVRQVRQSLRSREKDVW